MMKRVDHIGIAVNDLEESIRHYSLLLGMEPGGIEELPERGVRVATYRLGTVALELIQPFGLQGESIRRFLQKRGEGFHHICLEVFDIRAEVERLENAGMEALGPPVEGSGGSTVAFLRPQRGVLVELVERNPE